MVRWLSKSAWSLQVVHLHQHASAGVETPQYSKIKGVKHAKQKNGSHFRSSRDRRGRGSVYWRQNAESKGGSDGVGAAQGKRRYDVCLHTGYAAAELPTTRPETLGLFVERKDNSIILATISMDEGGGGVVVQAGGGDGESFAGSPVDNDGPKVEVVTTSETVVYLETTQPPGPPSSGENLVLQQTVAEGSLDDLTSQSFVTVWGRKSSDRIIAEVVFISNPVMFKRP